ncbi:unnamed protein product [Cuscuta europaea]|uniref:Ycf20-like protein n=1 Tax=Cuscuta europaea TaxID=41803 RepID=A0A9P1EL70_CUSEU|nr:unnamed protein product [Cuscuta europaea]
MEALMSQTFSVGKDELFERSYVFVEGSLTTIKLSNSHHPTWKSLKHGERLWPSRKTSPWTRRRDTSVVFALDMGRVPSNGDSRGLGGTRLGRIVGAGGQQLLAKLNSARKNFPVKIFLLLLGFYTANALATILGQTGDWDVLVAAIVVAVIEGIGMLMYRKPSSSLLTGRLQSLVGMVNYWKAGVCLGLFVDAFKLGS